MKEGKFKEAEEKLEKIKKEFDKQMVYLYYLYKGLLQSNPDNAIKYFDLAFKNSKNHALVNEKIADYFFSKGLFKESISYFRERFKITEKQVYSPELLEEEAHRKLSSAYMQESDFIRGFLEKMAANSIHSKNVKIEQEE
jgi:tetratricopeptide (TPR) repeat protein